MMLELFLSKISDLLELECPAKTIYSKTGEKDQLPLTTRQMREGRLQKVECHMSAKRLFP